MKRSARWGVVAAGIGAGISDVDATDAWGLSEKEKTRNNGSSRKGGHTADTLNLVLGELKKKDYGTETHTPVIPRSKDDR